mgnify:FL=1
MSNDRENPFNFDKLYQQEESAILHKLDERTERMDRRIERIDGRVIQQDETLAEHDNRIQRNTTTLHAITFGAGSFISAVLAKAGGLIKF